MSVKHSEYHAVLPVYERRLVERVLDGTVTREDVAVKVVDGAGRQLGLTRVLLGADDGAHVGRGQVHEQGGGGVQEGPDPLLVGGGRPGCRVRTGSRRQRPGGSEVDPMLSVVVSEGVGGVNAVMSCAEQPPRRILACVDARRQ